MRRIVTLVAAAALVGTVLTPSPAVGAESPLPQLTPEVRQALCQTPAQAPEADLPTPASVLLGPVDRQVPDAPQAPAAPQAVQSPQVCSSG